MRMKLLHQVAPFWEVGEVRPAGADPNQLVLDHEKLSASKHYPGDGPGRVISCIPATCEYSPGDTADPHRRVVPLDLSDRELTDVRSRRLKVGPFGLEPVTFDDRFGAVAVKLREKHEDPEAFEREEAEAVEAAEAANTADLKRFDLEQLAFEIARRDYTRDLVEFGLLDLGLEPPVAPVPPTPPVLIERENAFEREAVELAGALPRTVTHTGAGLYKVHAAGAMPTPAHLWAMETVDPPDDGDPGGNPGTGSNVTVVGGQIGSALEFNGTNSNVNIGDVAELNAVEKFAIAFWMNQDVLDVTDAIFRKNLDGTHGILASTSGGNFVFYVKDGSADFGVFDYSTVIDAGEWHHVTIVFDGTLTGNSNRLKIYVDGIQVALSFTGTIPDHTADTPGTDMTIGHTLFSFDGKLDDFRIYADALTDAEVKDIAGRGLAHWDTIAAFNENLLLESEAFTVAATWPQVGPISREQNTDTAPNGQKAADTISDSSLVNASYIKQSPTIPNDTNWIHASVYVKKDSDTSRFPVFACIASGGTGQSVYIQFNTATGATYVQSSVGIYSVNVTDVGTYWRVELGVKNNASGNIQGTLRVYPAYTSTWTGVAHLALLDSVVVWGAQLTLLTLQAYKPTRAATDTSITLTTGGLTDGERDGEVFVSGGNPYAVVRNGVDSVLVIGDATGESGACSISPYSTIQSALDQLWADQGVTTFTASQYIRIFAGTYDENVAPNSGILPAYQYRLFIEGDPADDRDNIVLAPSGGTAAFLASGSTAYGTFRHVHVAGSPTWSVQTIAVAYYWNLLDCYLGKAIHLLSLHRFEDCHLVGYARSSGMSILRCVFMGPGGAGTYAIYGGSSKHMFVESCAFYNYDIMVPRFHYGTKRIYSNCTFVSATYGLYLAYAFPYFDDQTLINCIFKDVDYPVWWIQKLLWPEETTTQVGTPWVLRNNRVHGHTAFASDGSSSKTLAEFEAMNRVDAAGNVEEDPLLTDPAAGDFSLQAASPCRHAGHGSGAVKDYLGTAFDAHHPDIGAWSSGALTLAAPTISSIADDGTTNSVTLSLGAENALDVLSVYYAKTSDATWTLFSSTRTGPGTLQITGLAVGWYDFVCVASRGGEVSLPSRSVRFAVMAAVIASPGAALNALLRADSTLAALVGDHIYPQAAPQGARGPYVVSTRVGGTPAHTIAAAAGFVEERFQIDSYGATLEDAQTIADAIRNVLDGYRGTVSAGSAQLVVGSIRRESDIDAFTEPAFAGGVGRHRVIQDYLMTHEESVPVFA